MKKIGIIGLGLIGGSIALCLKKKGQPDVWLKAYDQQSTHIQLAKSLGMIDEGCADLDEVITDADLLFLCIPVQSVYKLLPSIMNSPHLKQGAIITDVGSTKASIVQLAQTLTATSSGTFIGGHPMAGSHKSGVEAAHERLFENAYYVLTPTIDTDPEALETLKGVLTSTEAKIVEMQAEEHDQVVGAISHFPHVMASALVEHVHHYQHDNQWYFRLAAGGFKDITRIASSNPYMWRDIVLSNRQILSQQMKDWLQQMESLTHMIETGDEGEIEQFFAHAKQIRDGLPEEKQGAIPAFFDLFVDVPDHPGVIGEITTLLGEERISITNIEILETREDIMGVLRLSFRNEEDLQQASDLIQGANYAVYRRE